MPKGANSVEWLIQEARAAEASAPAFWPLGNTGLEKRLEKLLSPVKLIWGESDQVLPSSYADKLKTTVGGIAEIELISGAGHLAELDRHNEVANIILEFMN